MPLRTSIAVRLAISLIAIVYGWQPARAQLQSKPTSATASLYRIDAKSPDGLKDLLSHSAESLPLVSAHRGGPQAGFPENCIATCENTLRHTFAMLEVDPRYTKDGAIVLHHDPSLDRTTTGKGLLADH